MMALIRNEEWACEPGMGVMIGLASSALVGANEAPGPFPSGDRRSCPLFRVV